MTDPQGGTTSATAVIEVTGTLPSAEIQKSGTTTVNLQPVLQEIIKGSSGDDVLTFSGAAVTGDSFDGGAGADRLNLDGNEDNVISVANVEVVAGGAGDDAITISAPGTSGTSIASGGGSDSLILSSDFAFERARADGNNLIVSTKYYDASTETTASADITITNQSGPLRL